MVNINPNLYPPCGYTFLDADQVQHTAGDLNLLRDKVTAYRLRNDKPVGDPYREIVDQICTNYPNICRDVAVVSKSPQQVRFNLSNEVMKRLNTLFASAKKSPVTYVSKAEAERRMSICLGCPKNKEWRTGCAGCNAEFDRLSAVLRGGKSLVNQEKLLGCEGIGGDNRTEIWLDRPGEVIDDLPNNCWKKA